MSKLSRPLPEPHPAVYVILAGLSLYVGIECILALADHWLRTGG